MEIVFSLEQLPEVANTFWKNYQSGKIFAFHGTMGAGKTTFIHALCDEKKISGTMGSPTFSIINEYAYSEDGMEKKIFHMDLYRLKDEEEATQAGVEDCLYSGNICLVEWPEKAPGLFLDDTIQVYIELLDGQRRKLRVTGK